MNPFKQHRKAASPATASREPGEDRRDLLRTLYSPYTYLVYIPYVGVSTVFWGAAAVATSKVSRNLSFHCGTIWAWLLCRATFARVRVEGREHLVEGQSYVIMSNHQSHFDVLAFYGHFFKQFRWVIKQELRKVPGLGAGCESVGHIFIDRSSRDSAVASLNASRHLLDGGVSIMFFPEGERSKDGRIGAFKKGGFMMALDLNLPILPVSISGSRHVLPSQTLRLLPGEIRIRIHEPIDVSAYGQDRRDELMQDVARAIRSGLTPWERREAEGEGAT